MTPGGFAIGLHISFNGPSFLFQTFPQAWIDFYASNGLHLSDPAVAWSFAETGHIHWSELAKNDPNDVIGKAQDHGLSYGTTISLRDGGSGTVCGIARQDRDYLDAEIDAITAKLLPLHRATSGLSALSEDDMEALKRMSIRLSHG